MYIMNSVSQNPIGQQINKPQGINLKMRVIENKSLMSQLVQQDHQSQLQSTSLTQNPSIQVNLPGILQNQTSHQNYSELEQLYVYSYQYYVNTYGFPLKDIPQSLLPSIEDVFNDVYRPVAEVKNDNKLSEYKKQAQKDPKLDQLSNEKRQPADLELIFQNLWNLNIAPHELKYYPYAVVLNYLPLPPGVESVGNSNSMWRFNGKTYEKCYKPGMLYILRNLEYFRGLETEESTADTKTQEFAYNAEATNIDFDKYQQQENQGNKEKNLDTKVSLNWTKNCQISQRMHFWDGMGREYIVDLEKEYKKWFRNPNIVGENTLNLTKIYQTDIIVQGKDLDRLKKEREQNLREYIHESWADSKTDLVSSSKNLFFL